MKIIQVGSGGPNLDAAKEKWGIPDEVCCTDYDEALKREADLVIVALPHKFHIPYAKKAVEAGKNVLIEKPLTDNIQEAEEFLEFMKGRNERAFVSQNYRFRPQLWQMKASFGDDGIGRPAWASFSATASRTKKTAKKLHGSARTGGASRRVCSCSRSRYTTLTCCVL